MIKIHLKEILKDKGITSKDFAVKMGVSAAAISNIITGKNYPTYDLLDNMAKELNVKLSTLLGEEPLRIESNNDFASYIRYKGIHYTADTIDEFLDQVEEIKLIAK